MKRPFEKIVFPSGRTVGYAPEQVEWLAERGYVRRAGQVWRALVSKAEIEKLVIGSDNLAKCDFCSDRPVVTVFGAGDFEFLPHIPAPERHGSTGGWAACETCAGLIRAGDEDGLHAHATERLLGVLRGQGMYPTDPEMRVVEESIRAAQADFWVRRDKTETEVEKE